METRLHLFLKSYVVIIIRSSVKMHIETFLSRFLSTVDESVQKKIKKRTNQNSFKNHWVPSAGKRAKLVPSAAKRATCAKRGKTSER